MKHLTKAFLFLTILLSFPPLAKAQDNKTVALSVYGQGKTEDEATQNALRNAIEQAFGTFISSKTEILNDALIRDEIISIGNGNIQKFEVISKVQIPDGGFATTLKATVSVTKLTSFCESKGINVEFKGALFAFNIKQQMLNEQNEIEAVKQMIIVLKNIIDKSFDYYLTVETPKASGDDNKLWNIPMLVSIKTNNNFISINNYLNNTLKGLSLSDDEIKNYEELGKHAYYIKCDDKFYLRRKESIIYILIDLMSYFCKSSLNFAITDDKSTRFLFSDFLFSDLNDKERFKTAIKTEFNPIKFGYGEHTFLFQKFNHNIYEMVEYLRDHLAESKDLLGQLIPYHYKDYFQLNNLNNVSIYLYKYADFTDDNKEFQFMGAKLGHQDEWWFRFSNEISLSKYSDVGFEIAKVSVVLQFTIDQINNVSGFKVIKNIE
jgi:hypothetical protein